MVECADGTTPAGRLIRSGGAQLTAGAARVTSLRRPVSWFTLSAARPSSAMRRELQITLTHAQREPWQLCC
jgi:hypothetical protein